VILQCAYILDAVREFDPEVLVGHQLTLGPNIVREVVGVPLAVIGLAAWMYPTRSGSGLWLSRDESAWRHSEFIERLNEVRQRLTTSPLETDFETPIQVFRATSSSSGVSPRWSATSRTYHPEFTLLARQSNHDRCWGLISSDGFAMAKGSSACTYRTEERSIVHAFSI